MTPWPDANQIAECVDVHGDRVFVVREGVARQHVGADPTGFAIEAQKRDVERLAVVAHVHDRPLGHVGAVVRKALNEPFDRRHAGRRAGDRHFSEVRKNRRSRNPRDQEVRRRILRERRRSNECDQNTENENANRSHQSRMIDSREEDLSFLALPRGPWELARNRSRGAGERQ
jgi:hypothetical protein